MEHQVNPQENAIHAPVGGHQSEAALPSTPSRINDLLRLQRQAGNRVVARLVADEAETQRVAGLRQSLADAIRYEHWREAATLLNAFSATDLDALLKPLNVNQKAALYEGALSADGVGPDSAAARATRPAYLDSEIAKNRVSGQWGWVAQYLNAFNEPDLLQRLQAFTTSEIQSIRDAAQSTSGVGPDSTVAKLTATVLEQRRNTPPSAAEKLGQELYDALHDGINQGDAHAITCAKGLASTFYEVHNRAHGEVAVEVDVTRAHAVARRVGISPESLDRVIDLVRPFAPKARHLYMDYAGRVGTKEDLAQREQADKIAAAGEATSTLGSLMMSYVAAKGGNAAEMRNANALGGALEGLASTIPMSGSATATAHSTVEEPNRTGVDTPPASKTERDPDISPTPRPEDRIPPGEITKADPPTHGDAPPAGGGHPPGGGDLSGPTDGSAGAAKPKSKPWEKTPQPLVGGGGGNKRASAEALAERGDIKGFPEGPRGPRKAISTQAGQSPTADAGENASAEVFNAQVGKTYHSPEEVVRGPTAATPEAKTVSEGLTIARERDGLNADKNPDLLVLTAHGWQFWDVRTLQGGTANAKSALESAGKKASDGQARRIVINLDGVSNDGATFANELREAVKADRKQAPEFQESAALKELVVVKGGVMYRALTE